MSLIINNLDLERTGSQLYTKSIYAIIIEQALVLYHTIFQRFRVQVTVQMVREKVFKCIVFLFTISITLDAYIMQITL